MKKNLFFLVISYLIETLSRSAKKEIQVSFKEAILNDYEKHKFGFLSVPVFFLLALQLVCLSLGLFVYGVFDFFMNEGVFSSSVFMSSLVLFVLALIMVFISLFNLKLILKRVQKVRESIQQIQNISPFHKLYLQFQKENKMLLESLLSFKDKTHKIRQLN